MRKETFTESQLVAMKSAYTMGEASLSSLAEQYQVSVPTVAKYLRKAGAQIRSRGRPKDTDSVTVQPGQTIVFGEKNDAS